MANNWKYVLMMSMALPTAAAFAQSGDAGRKAVELERYQQAKNIYKSQLNNKNADNAYFALGDIYVRTEQLDSAAYYFNQGLAKNSKSAINMVGQGKIALEQGNKAEAQRLFEQAVKQSRGKDAYVLAMVGEAYAHADNATDQELNKAAEYLQQAVDRDKNNAMAYVIMGDVKRKLKKSGEAMTAYENAIRIDGNYATAHYKKGSLYTSSRNYQEAEQSLNKAIQVDPNFAPAYSELAHLHYYKGQYDPALATFKQYMNLAERTTDTQAKYASFLFLTKNYEETLKEAQQVLQTQPNNTTMNRLVAYSYLETKQPEKALQAIESYINKTDASKLVTDDYENYAKILGRNKRYEDAVKAYNKAIELEPTKPELYTELATAYVGLEQYDKAIETYELKREKIEPLNSDYFYMGNIYMQAGEFKKADDTYAKVLETNPTYAYGYLWRAQANANLDPESTKGLAKPHYEKFIELAAAEPEKYKRELVEANYYLGAYYYLVDANRDSSIKHFKRVLELDPQNQQATTALEQINKTPRAKK